MKQHDEHVNPSKIKLVSLISFLFGFSDAFLVYILSVYFKEVSGTENVSFIYLIAFSIILVALLYFHDIIRKIGKSMLLYLLLIGMIIISAILILASPSWFTIAVLIAHLVMTNLIWVNLDIILESFSEDGKSGRIRGLFLTIVNIGWLLAPILSTRLLLHSGFKGIFFVGLVMYAVILTIALLGLRRISHQVKDRITPRQMFKKIRHRSDVLRIYAIALSIEFFYAVMVVYTPLHLLKIGFGWGDIGLMFTIMLLPFALIQYPLGVLADKRWGEKEMLIFFLFLMIVSTVYIPFITAHTFWIWAIALLFTRIGAAGIDILRDSYFYKRIGPDDVDLIAFFRTARSVANICAALVVGVTLLFLPLLTVFFIAAGVLVLGLVPALLLEDNVSERDMARVIAS